MQQWQQYEYWYRTGNEERWLGNGTRRAPRFGKSLTPRPGTCSRILCVLKLVGHVECTTMGNGAYIMGTGSRPRSQH